MTKAELEAENKELKEKVETLEDEITRLEEAYSDLTIHSFWKVVKKNVSSSNFI